MLIAPIIVIDCPLVFGSSIRIPSLSHTLEGAYHRLNVVSSMYTISTSGQCMMVRSKAWENYCCYAHNSFCLSFFERYTIFGLMYFAPNSRYTRHTVIADSFGRFSSLLISSARCSKLRCRCSIRVLGFAMYTRSEYESIFTTPLLQTREITRFPCYNQRLMIMYCVLGLTPVIRKTSLEV